MKLYKIRLIILICVLLWAINYRFPVHIQELTMKIREYIDTLSGQIRAVNKPAAKAAKEAPNKNKYEEHREDIILIKLKNGREMEGLLVSDQGGMVEIDIGIGTVKVSRNDIVSMTKPSELKVKEIIEEWKGTDKDVIDSKRTAIIRYYEADRIIAAVTINDDIKAKLLVDTGAPYMTIRPRVGAKVFDDREVVSKDVMMQWTDGSSSNGKLVLLDSVQVGKVKIPRVRAVIAEISILEDHLDGLIGMSYLRFFNVKLDSATKTMILEKR